MYNLQRYIQHEMALYDYSYDEDEFDHPLAEPNQISQTRGKYMKILIMNSTDTKDFKATSNQKLVSFKKGIKREETAYPHSKMRDTSMSSAEVSSSLQNHMSVNKC